MFTDVKLADTLSPKDFIELQEKMVVTPFLRMSATFVNLESDYM